MSVTEDRRPLDADAVRAAVARLLDRGEPSIAGLAAELHCSIRTLQRRLRAEGTSFSELLAALRRDLAVRAIAETEVPIAEVSARLGYGQPSALSRAVRRWTGVPPRALRAGARLGRHD